MLSLKCTKILLTNPTYVVSSIIRQARAYKHDTVFRVLPKIQEAVQRNLSVVALESTIITHGMPYPDNLRTAQAVEKIVKDCGATPATIAVLSGCIHVGLDEDQLEFLASDTRSCIKISRRDLPYAISQRVSGGTTVSGTMIAAHQAGVPIFVTGGIGGVHRGAEVSMDVSADLRELGRTPVTVISAGVKSILDIEKTLEYLETEGVCVVVYGPTRDFPAFFTPSSGFQASYNVTNPVEAAEMIYSHHQLGLESAILIAAPIPHQYSHLGDVIDKAIGQALDEAQLSGIKGKETTPFLLQKVNELTKGKSLEANIALIKNNARIGSEIAVELSKLNNRKNTRKVNYGGRKNARPVVVGGSNVDFIAKFRDAAFQVDGATYPGSILQTFGGVGRNLADGLARLDCNPLFITAVGRDSHAEALLHYCDHMDLSGFQTVDNASTATYCAVLTNSGELLYGIGDMAIHQYITPNHVRQFEEEITKAPLVLMDGNIPVETMDYICTVCRGHQVPVLYEPTDVDKASKPFQADWWQHSIQYISPNLKELKQIYSHVTGNNDIHVASTDDLSVKDWLHVTRELCNPLLDFIPTIVVTLGGNGVIVCRNCNHDYRFALKGSKIHIPSEKSYVHYRACQSDQIPRHIVSVSGAGDSLLAGMIFAALQNKDTDVCIKTGLLAANLSLQSHHPIPDISPNTLHHQTVKEWWKPQ